MRPGTIASVAAPSAAGGGGGGAGTGTGTGNIISTLLRHHMSQSLIQPAKQLQSIRRVLLRLTREPFHQLTHPARGSCLLVPAAVAVAVAVTVAGPAIASAIASAIARAIALFQGLIVGEKMEMEREQRMNNSGRGSTGGELGLGLVRVRVRMIHKRRKLQTVKQLLISTGSASTTVSTPTAFEEHFKSVLWHWR